MRYVLFVSLLACAEPQSSEPLVSHAQIEPIEIPTAQIEHGRQLFAANCASCHGDAGQGTNDGPAIYGSTALPLEPPMDSKRDLLFRSAADVLAWSMKTMPIDNPASLPAEDYVAIVAYVVSEHGVTLDRPLDAANAHSVAIQP